MQNSFEPDIKAVLDEAANDIKQGDIQSGKKKLEWVLQREPDNVLAWLWMSRCFQDREKKLDCFKKVLEIDPSNKNALDGVRLYHRGIRSTRGRKQSQKFKRVIVGLGILLAVFVIFGTIYILSATGIIPGRATEPVIAEVSQSTVTADILLTEEPSPTFTKTWTPTRRPTFTPQPSKTPRPTNTRIPTKTPTATFVVQTKTIGPIYDSLRDCMYSVEITINNVEWFLQAGYSEPKLGNTYVVVHIKVVNQGPGSVRSFGPSDFQVKDANNVLRDYEYLSILRDTCWLDRVDLMKGAILEGCVSFEVPKEGLIEFIYAPFQYEGLEPGRYLSFVIR